MVLEGASLFSHHFGHYVLSLHILGMTASLHGVLDIATVGFTPVIREGPQGRATGLGSFKLRTFEVRRGEEIQLGTSCRPTLAGDCGLVEDLLCWPERGKGLEAYKLVPGHQRGERKGLALELGLITLIGERGDNPEAARSARGTQGMDLKRCGSQ